MAQTALKRFELENNIAETDQIYQLNPVQYNAMVQTRPWQNDPHYFKNVRISAIALLKMVMHARSGGKIEVMGMLMGKIDGPTMIVMDAFPLPVDGTEVRVNAGAEANEYMVDYISESKTRRPENILGWYHSHPGYGCWLSGIDVTTQMLHQQFEEPYLALVVDPTRTISAGKVTLGAFRTYPSGYKAPDDPPGEYQTIPINKIEDFGVHCKQYYPLDVSYFKNSLDNHLLDKLWNKYWVNTLSSSPIFANRDYIAGQIGDLSEKLEQAETHLSHSGRVGTSFMSSVQAGVDKKKEESQLSKIAKDSTKTTLEQVHGIMSQVIKDVLFNSVGSLEHSGISTTSSSSSSSH